MKKTVLKCSLTQVNLLKKKICFAARFANLKRINVAAAIHHPSPQPTCKSCCVPLFFLASRQIRNNKRMRVEVKNIKKKNKKNIYITYSFTFGDNFRPSFLMRPCIIAKPTYYTIGIHYHRIGAIKGRKSEKIYANESQKRTKIIRLLKNTLKKLNLFKFVPVYIYMYATEYYCFLPININLFKWSII